MLYILVSSKSNTCIQATSYTEKNTQLYEKDSLLLSRTIVRLHYWYCTSDSFDRDGGVLPSHIGTTLYMTIVHVPMSVCLDTGRYINET